MLTIRTAATSDAATLCDAERRTAMTPGLLASRPTELRAELFEEKIESLATRGRYIVAELRVRSTNARAIGLYKKLGFVEEGRFRRRLRLEDGTFVDDVAMAYFPAKKTAGG